MYFGKYRGKVVGIDDPEKRGRIKVECPAVLGKQISQWALPCLPPFVFYIPPVGSLVWVEFEEGKIDSPIWSGLFYTLEGWAKGAGEYDNKKSIINTPLDNKIIGGKKMDIIVKEDTTIKTEAKLMTNSVGETSLKSEDKLTTSSVGETSLKSDAEINTKSGSATNITVGSTLNWNQG